MAIAFTGTIGNLRLDNMRVTLAGAELGYTEGGVEIGVATSIVEVTGDQYGSTPLNTYNAGDRVTIKFTIKETTLANLNKALYGSTLRSTGGTGVGVGGKLSSSLVGTTVNSSLLFHPLDTDDATLTKDINVWKAVCVRCSPIKYGPDNITMFETEWVAILDTTKTAGKQLIDFGLAAAT